MSLTAKSVDANFQNRAVLALLLNYIKSRNTDPHPRPIEVIFRIPITGVEDGGSDIELTVPGIELEMPFQCSVVLEIVAGKDLVFSESMVVGKDETLHSPDYRTISIAN